MKTPALAACAVLALSAGCQGPREQPAADFDEVDGVGVKVGTSLAWAHDPALPDRLHRVISAAATYGGGSASQLHGWVVVLEDTWAECSGIAPHSTLGCTRWGEERIGVDVNGVDCVEQTVLAHEVLHAIIGDACHRSPLWRDFTQVENALRDGECEVSADKWRTDPTCD
jgi:hypothetical protein